MLQPNCSGVKLPQRPGGELARPAIRDFLRRLLRRLSIGSQFLLRRGKLRFPGGNLLGQCRDLRRRAGEAAPVATTCSAAAALVASSCAVTNLLCFGGFGRKLLATGL